MKNSLALNRSIFYKLFLVLFALGLSTNTYAQVSSIVGEWKTVNDRTNESLSVVRIYKSADGLYYGKIVKMFKYADAVCIACKGADNGKPLVGLVIIRGMKDAGGRLEGGYILDPESGKEYYATIKYDSKTGKLQLRGSLDKRGIIGRSQYWVKHI